MRLSLRIESDKLVALGLLLQHLYPLSLVFFGLLFLKDRYPISLSDEVSNCLLILQRCSIMVGVYLPLLVFLMESDFHLLKQFDLITHILLFYFGIFQEIRDE